MNTLLLATNTWDLCVDANHNIAMATDPYAIAQDVASACRLFLNELWYDTTQGIPYFQRVLGKFPSANFLKAQLEAAARTVPEVVSANAFLTAFGKPTRVVIGQVQSAIGTQIKLTLVGGQIIFVGTQSIQSMTPWYVTAGSPQALGSGSGGP